IDNRLVLDVVDRLADGQVPQRHEMPHVGTVVRAADDNPGWRRLDALERSRLRIWLILIKVLNIRSAGDADLRPEGRDDRFDRRLDGSVAGAVVPIVGP